MGGFMKKKVLFLIESLRNGGSEKSISNIATDLSNQYNVVLVLADKKENDFPFPGKVIEINEFLSKNPIKRFIGIKKLKAIKKENHIDISISYLTAYNFYNVLSKYHDKIFISIRNHLSSKKEGFLARIAAIYSNQKANKIICCSKSVQTDQIKNFHAKKDKTVVIENYCNPVLKNHLKKDNTILTIGRLTKHKGQEHIIKAMSLVIKKIPEAKLIILGRGEEKIHLEALLEKYNLKENVELLGFHRPDPYFEKAKLFVLASDYEGFSNALLEAMNYSIPVIATSSPGGNCEIISKEEYQKDISKSIHSKYGVLIPNFKKEHGTNSITKNEKILAKEIINLLINKKDYQFYKKKSKERANDYRKEIIIQKWRVIIEEDSL